MKASMKEYFTLKDKYCYQHGIKELVKKWFYLALIQIYLPQIITWSNSWFTCCTHNTSTTERNWKFQWKSSSPQSKRINISVRINELAEKWLQMVQRDDIYFECEALFVVTWRLMQIVSK